MDTAIDIALKFAAITVAFVVVLLIVAYTVLAERRILGFIQGRLGPNRVGYGGMLQPFADLLKFILKEDIVPDKSTRFVYFLAPVIATMAALMTMIVYPFGPEIRIPFTSITIPLVIAHFDVGLLYVLGVTSIGVYGIALAGWSSNNKYSLMGGLRSAAQMISYELALGLSLIGVIMLAGTLDLAQIVELQSGWHGFRWFIFFQPLGFIIYLTAAIAETNRVPFDLPEAETELVAGFHTEYSAMKFALFLGGLIVPFAEEIFGRGTFLFGLVSAIGFLLKVIFFLFIYIWLRGTLPRFRFDQLMSFGWKILLPLALFSLFITATLIFLFPNL
jgi:NADH-quinone oxidoreductase subunit H